MFKLSKPDTVKCLRFISPIYNGWEQDFWSWKIYIWIFLKMYVIGATSYNCHYIPIKFGVVLNNNFIVLYEADYFSWSTFPFPKILFLSLITTIKQTSLTTLLSILCLHSNYFLTIPLSDAVLLSREDKYFFYFVTT